MKARPTPVSNAAHKMPVPELFHLDLTGTEELRVTGKPTGDNGRADTLGQIHFGTPADGRRYVDDPNVLFGPSQGMSSSIIEKNLVPARPDSFHLRREVSS
jgi:hypothetical protein